MLVMLCLGFATQVEAKTVCVERELECQDSRKCSRYLVKQLETAQGIRVESREAGDTVQGSVSIHHGTPHLLCVEVYDAPTESLDGIHLRPPLAQIPDAALEAMIQSVPKSWSRMNGFDHRLEHEVARDNIRASGDAKLKALGLTDAEIEARRP